MSCSLEFASTQAPKRCCERSHLLHWLTQSQTAVSTIWALGDTGWCPPACTLKAGCSPVILSGYRSWWAQVLASLSDEAMYSLCLGLSLCVLVFCWLFFFWQLMGLSSLLVWFSRSANLLSFQPQIVPLLGSVLDEVFIICVFRSCRDMLSGAQLFANGGPYQIASVTVALPQA